MKTDYSDGIEGMRKFAENFAPSPAAVDWARSCCGSMAEVWDKAPSDWLVWIATREGVFDDRTLRLFACWCARQVWHLLTDERSRRVVECAERYADGLASGAELYAACEAAWSAASEKDSAAARASASAASCDSALSVCMAREAASEAWESDSAARAAACEAQAEYLRKLGNPFRGEA